MANVNTQAIQDALDAGFSQEEITAEMTKQGLAEQDVSEAMKGFRTPQTLPLDEQPEIVPNQINDVAFDGLQKELPILEGTRNDVYFDSEGNLTVGIGHLITPEDGLKAGDAISDEQVQQLFHKDSTLAFTSASEQAQEAGISDPEFVKALGKVNFQLGTAWNKKFDSTWQDIKDGNFESAANKVSNSLWARQTPIRAQEFAGALRSMAKGDFEPGAEDTMLNEVQNPNSTIMADLQPEQIDNSVSLQTVRKGTGATLEDAQFAAAKYENIVRKYNTFKSLQAFTGSPEAKKDLANDAAWVNQFIFDNMKDKGFEMAKVVGVGPNQVLIGPEDPRFNDVIQNMELAFRGEDGEFKLLTPSILQDLNAMRFETAGAVLGATAGAAAASQVPIPPVSVPTAIAKLVVVGGGALAGGAAGAFTGRGLDIAYNAALMKEDLDNIRVFDQMMDAAYTDALFTVGGGVVFKGIAAGGKLTYNAAGKLVRDIGAFDTRAKNTLKRLLNISDTQFDEIVQEWSAINKIQVDTLSTKEKLGIVATTSRRGDILVGAAAGQSFEVANKLALSIDQRAKEMIKLSKTLIDPNTSRNVLEDLKAVSADSKALHEHMKLEGKQLIPSKKVFTVDPGTSVSQEGITVVGSAAKKTKVVKETGPVFNFNELIIQPVEKRLAKDIQNPAQFNKITSFLTRLQNTSMKRDFKALLDTRTVISDFIRQNPSFTKTQQDTLNRALGNIDKLVKTEALQVEGGKEWLEAYSKSIKKRDEIFVLRDNVLFKGLQKEGLSPDEQIKLFSKYMRAEDGTYQHVIKQLDKSTAAKVETSVVDNLLNSHTLGDEGGIQAIKFPELSEELEKYAFKSADAKNMKQLVKQMATVYENDPNLARISGRVVGSPGASGIGTNLIERAKVQFATNMFAKLTKVRPGKVGGETVLIDKLTKVLENPLDTNAIDILFRDIQAASKSKTGQQEFIRETVGDSLRNMQIEAVKRGGTGRPDIPRSTVYATSRAGKERVVRNGPLGFGLYYKRDRSKASSQITSSLHRVTSREVPNYRVANEEMITELLKPVIGDRIPLAKDIKQHQDFIKKELQARGYLGYVFNEDMLLFN